MQLYEDFPDIFMLLFLSWPKNIFHIISNTLNLLRLILWTSRWSILVKVSCELQENVYCAFAGWNVLSISISAYCLIVYFSFQTLYFSSLEVPVGFLLYIPFSFSIC